MSDLSGWLKSHTHPLRVWGQALNGAAFTRLASAYVAAINAGAVPQLVTAWQVGGTNGKACDAKAALCV